MSQSAIKMIVYLFGAGATHAELDNLEQDLIEKGKGLLIKDVSARVIAEASRDAAYLKDVELVSATWGKPNIELLISLIENSKIQGWERKTQYLKDQVQKDIETILTGSRTKHFYLHNALFEFHGHRMTQTKERLIGLISLNYDDVLDAAYRRHFREPNYCFSSEQNTAVSRRLPLLKLHGSFNWSGQTIRGRKRNIAIIPLGSNKNYLHAPYCFIWNRAMELLIECDILRVIGCSLSQNDFHLVDLLFKAHLERSTALDIEIIDFEATGENIRGNYGFFPRIRTLTEIEPPLIPDLTLLNPFKTWLKYKILDMLEGHTGRMANLKAVIS